MFIFVHNEAFDLRDPILHAASSSSYLWVQTTVVTSVGEALTHLKGATNLATSLHTESTNIYETDMALDDVAIWFGNEHRGQTRP